MPISRHTLTKKIIASVLNCANREDQTFGRLIHAPFAVESRTDQSKLARSWGACVSVTESLNNSIFRGRRSVLIEELERRAQLF